MKKQIFTMIQVCLLILTLVGWQSELHAQTPFTITWTGLTGSTNATGVPTGITVTQQYNGMQAVCNTGAQNGATTSYNGVIQVAAGYTVTITSIGGAAYGSGAGSKKFTLQLTNGSPYVQTNPTIISTSSNCAGNTPLNAFAIPAAGQTLNAGSSATVTVLRGIGGSETGGGYSFTRLLTITGTITPISTCTAPTGLLASGVTSSSANLSWNTVSGATGYQYVVDQVSTNPAGAGTATTGTTYNPATLNPSTNYYLHVRTDCGSGSFSSWTTIPFTTLAAACTAPTGLNAANITDHTADLSWGTVSGAAGYEYTIDQLSTDPATAGTSTTSTTFNATLLNESSTYYLHVRTDCGSGSFSSWTTIPFTTIATPCDAPTGLTADNVTDHTADLSWTAQAGVTDYEYVADQTITDPATAGTSTTATTFNATLLNESSTYYLHVRTQCANGQLSPWTTISFTTIATPCDAPTGLTADNVTDHTADLSWTAQAGVTDYEYVVDQTMADPATAGTSTTATTYNATLLDESSTYYLHVRTQCANGQLSPWTTISFTTIATPCDAPTGLTADNVTDHTADLSWTAQAGVTDYEYVVDQTMTDPATAGTSTTATTYNATLLDESSTYYLHVRTQCANGQVSPWTTISFTTIATPCDAPTDLTADNVTDHTADLSWTAQAGVTDYEYVVDQTTTDPATAGTSTTATTYNATLLDESSTYYLHVRTQCANGQVSPWATISFTTIATPCDAPTGLTADNITDHTADLSWTAQAGVTDYEYVVDQTTTDPATAGTSTTATTYNATLLDESSTYYLHVRTQCANGQFSPWTTIPFTTIATPCDAPTGLTADNITDHTADLSWTAQTGVTGYEYVVDQATTLPTGAGTATTGTTYGATLLNESSTYYLHVRTQCANGQFSPWTTIPFTTIATPCDAPTGLSATNITENSATLSWNVQSGSTFEYVIDEVAAAPATAGTVTSATTYNATLLDPETTYYLHVRTQCANGEFSPWTTIPFTTLVTPCPVPTGLNVSNIAGHSANVAWTMQSGNTFEYVIDQNNTNPAGNGTATSTNSFAATSLTGLTTYYFHVRTDCGNGNFSEWTTISFTTTSTVGIEEEETINLTAYPNPATNLVTILGQTAGTIRLTNLKGQQLMTIDLEKTAVLDISNLESGLYFLMYSNENKTALIKLIKQ